MLFSPFCHPHGGYTPRLDELIFTGGVLELPHRVFSAGSDPGIHELLLTDWAGWCQASGGGRRSMFSQSSGWLRRSFSFGPAGSSGNP